MFLYRHRMNIGSCGVQGKWPPWGVQYHDLWSLISQTTILELPTRYPWNFNNGNRFLLRARRQLGRAISRRTQEFSQIEIFNISP